MPSPELRKSARIFTVGAVLGFFAGAMVLAVIVWQFGNVIGTRAALGREPRPSPIERWDGGTIDDDSPVLEAAVPTTGTIEGEDPTAPAARSSTAVPPGPPVISAPPAAELADRDLALPVEGVTADQLVRSFEDARGTRRHQAIDILAPKGTPVRAIEDGRVARLFVSKAGGITIYQFDPTERYCYYYAHLDRYAEGLRENAVVRRGQVVGYVGTTGNAPKDTPHLHFAIFRLTAEKRWWEGTPIDPYDVLR